MTKALTYASKEVTMGGIRYMIASHECNSQKELDELIFSQDEYCWIYANHDFDDCAPGLSEIRERTNVITSGWKYFSCERCPFPTSYIEALKGEYVYYKRLTEGEPRRALQKAAKNLQEVGFHYDHIRRILYNLNGETIYVYGVHKCGNGIYKLDMRVIYLHNNPYAELRERGDYVITADTICSGQGTTGDYPIFGFGTLKVCTNQLYQIIRNVRRGKRREN